MVESDVHTYSMNLIAIATDPAPYYNHTRLHAAHRTHDAAPRQLQRAATSPHPQTNTMSHRTVRHTKTELLSLLSARCPDALARFPAPSAFTFSSDERGTFLRLGRCVDSAATVRACCYGDGVPQLAYAQHRGPAQAGIQLEGVLGTLCDSEVVDAGDVALKIIVCFVFVYCGYRDVFADLESGPAVAILVRRLERLVPKKVRKFDYEGVRARW
jgi:hypothetical protein